MDNEHNRALMEGIDDPLVGPGAHRDGSPEVPAAKAPLDPLDPAEQDDLLAAGQTSGVAIDQLAQTVADDARLETGWTGSGDGEDV